MREENYNWFIDNYDELVRQYGMAYLGIRERKVMGTFDGLASGIIEMLKHYPDKDFLVQKCDPTYYAYNAYLSSINLGK